MTEKPMPPTLLLAAVCVMIGLHFICPVRIFMPAFRWIPGCALIVFGIALNLLADGLFNKHGTTVKPFHESSALVTSGVFRFSRHPMYLGMGFILAGLAIVLGSLTPWFAVAAFVIVVEVVFVRREEAMLEKTFGDEFRNYKRQVRKWF